MSRTVPIQQAAAHLAELVSALKPGDEIVLTERDRPVARIVPSGGPPIRRRPGSCRGMLIIRKETDEHLKDFGEYMP